MGNLIYQYDNIAKTDSLKSGFVTNKHKINDPLAKINSNNISNAYNILSWKRGPHLCGILRMLETKITNSERNFTIRAHPQAFLGVKAPLQLPSVSK